MTAENQSSRNDDREVWANRSAKIERLRRQGVWLPGPTTALEILAKTGNERSHQAYIAWLLTPRGEHGLGSRLLANLMAQFSPAQATSAQLATAHVATEVVRQLSRADIVATTNEITLIVELKVHSDEGEDQTRRLADDYATSPNPLRIFLTLHEEVPEDPRFHPMSFRQLTECLRNALDDAPEPVGSSTFQARASANDYLSTIERMCGMDPVNQYAALFWLRHGADMKKAELEAIRVLELLPSYVEEALRALANDLGGNLQVTRFPYEAIGKRGTYKEVAILLHRPQWNGSDARPRFGVGYGARLENSLPLIDEKKPFFGVWSEDASDRALLGDKHWAKWAWWDYLRLTPPADCNDLLAWCAEVTKDHVRQAWHEYVEKVGSLAT